MLSVMEKILVLRKRVFVSLPACSAIAMLTCSTLQNLPSDTAPTETVFSSGQVILQICGLHWKRRRT